MARPPLGTKTLAGGETLSIWKLRIEAALKQWHDDEQGYGRERIRRMISELKFPILMVRDLGAGAAVARQQNPQIDQYDLNLALRYTQKLRSMAGDEEPRLRWARDWTRPWNQVAYLWDRLIMSFMERAGAAENNSDGAQDTCSDGVTSHWVGLAYDLPADVNKQAAQSAADLIDVVLADPESYEPVEGQDHPLIAETFETRAFEAETMQADPTGFVADALIDAAALHWEAWEEERKNGRVDYRYDRRQITHERLPYGTRALMDPTASSFRECRWVARLLFMPIEEARNHPAFHPGIRKKLMPDPGAKEQYEGTDGGRMVPGAAVEDSGIETGDESGFIRIWEIHDKRHYTIHYLHMGTDRFLNAGMRGGIPRERHPFLDENGRPLFRSMKTYPGFFPVDFATPLPPKRDNEKKKEGIPLLAPGAKILFALTKTFSSHTLMVRRASAAMYEGHPKLPQSARRAIQAGIDGTVFTRPADVPPGESVVPLQWKPPSEHLYRSVNDMLDWWCILQSFPKTELTASPTGETATQDQMAQMAGDSWWWEVIRRFEVSYGVQAYLMSVLAYEFLSEEDWAEEIGEEDARMLWEVTDQVGIPHRLPEARFASKRRDQNPVRVMQLATFDERLTTKVDPLTGMPRYDDEALVQEQARSLDLGRIEPYQPDQRTLEMIAAAKGQALAEAQMAEGDLGGEEGGGRGTTTGEVESRPATNGSPGGSASQSRGSDSARRSRRGGRRGRAAGPPTGNQQASAAQDLR